MSIKLSTFFGIACVNALLFSSPLFSCTDFNLPAEDGSILVTRTMEFGLDLASNLRSSNRGRHFDETTPDGKPAISWTAKYGYLFLDGLQFDAAIDGMNEKGLSIEALYLPGDTEYPNVTIQADKKNIPYIHFGDWVLSNFQNTDEVRAALDGINVFGSKIPGLGDMIFPLHFVMYDTQGKSIAVEFVHGNMMIHNNKIGVFTNSPTYDWQIINLRNYINLSPYTPDPVEYNGMTFITTGQGSGMKGLPGDSSPPSRFVKMAVLKKVAYPVKNSDEALTLAQHIINTVDIPIGLVRAHQNGKTIVENTEWTVFKDLTHKIFYYRTYGNTTLNAVNYSKIDFSEHAKRLKMPIAAPQYIVNKDQQFLNSPSSE